MKMRAIDSFCGGDVGMQHAGSEFEVSDARGKELAARGLAAEVSEGQLAQEAAEEEQTDAPKAPPARSERRARAPKP